jgi:spore maturation protein CgeB
MGPLATQPHGVQSLKILHLGPNSGTSKHRKEALVRLGHEVVHVDPCGLLPANRIVSLLQWYAGSLGVAEIVRRRALRALSQVPPDFDLAWVEQGTLISPAFLKDLKARISRVLCYTIDDPFGGRDRLRWRQFFNALPDYDLLVVVRACNVPEAYEHGACNVLRVFMSADEIAHSPRQLSAEEQRHWGSEVVFVGTAFPERGPFLAELVKLGVPLTIFGNYYHRLPQWPLLRPHWRPADTGSSEDYAKAISASKVCLGLLSKGNRDQHTTRSMEIPSLGGLLCAERTSEHLALYEEDREAVFWSTAQECASKCLSLLNDAPRRQAIATAGRQRYLNNPWRNMAVIETILRAAVSPTVASGAALGAERVSESNATHGRLAMEIRSGPSDVYVNSPSTR